MSTLETRIAEVLAAHSYHVEPDYIRAVSTIVCNCGNRYGLGESHRAHQAAALAPVIAEAQAEAWDACVHAADKQWTIGHTSAQLLRNTNPYRSNDE